MVEVNVLELLKVLLRREVERFCRRNASQWKIPVLEMLDEIHRNDWRAVFFGGTLRSLLMSRLVHRQDGRPRDIDIVIHGPPLDILRKLFGHFVARETRFGGLHLRRADWLFDVWPLEKTWALVKDQISHPAFADLPHSTFLNLEAVAIDVWPKPGRDREIYSGDDRFFKGILNRTVEINRAENPFPELCVVRSLIMTSELEFRIGKHLAQYIAHHGSRLTALELERVQEHHYGKICVEGETLRKWIRFVTDSLDSSEIQELKLPVGNPKRTAIDTNGNSYKFIRAVERWHQRGKPHAG
jgi:hypothetical protein